MKKDAEGLETRPPPFGGCLQNRRVQEGHLRNKAAPCPLSADGDFGVEAVPRGRTEIQNCDDGGAVDSEDSVATNDENNDNGQTNTGHIDINKHTVNNATTTDNARQNPESENRCRKKGRWH